MSRQPLHIWRNEAQICPLGLKWRDLNPDPAFFENLPISRKEAISETSENKLNFAPYPSMPRVESVYARLHI